MEISYLGVLTVCAGQAIANFFGQKVERIELLSVPDEEEQRIGFYPQAQLVTDTGRTYSFAIFGDLSGADVGLVDDSKERWTFFEMVISTSGIAIKRKSVAA